MSLFEVKGWDVPSPGVASLGPQSSKKRKRPAGDVDKIHTAQVNVEKLMRKVERSAISSRNEPQKGRRKGRRTEDTHILATSRNPEAKSQAKVRTQDKNSEREVKIASLNAGTSLPKRVKKKGSRTQSRTDDALSLRQQKKLSRTTESTSGLTSLQASMKDTLEGARFRWINEVLYTTRSIEGHRLMREDPKLYEEYHTGFRQQVRSWPSNPVNHYIDLLSSYPRGTVIADIGCGDAALARALIPKGYCVLSFDLVSDGAYVVEADVCERIPLPGMDNSADDNEGQIVHVCICALSLMSLDWINCVREAWRILRSGGELKVAEVASRFTNLNEFITIITELGFKLKSKDDSNTHFTLFDFEKVSRPLMSNRKWEDLRAKHKVLQPCEYKRR